MYLMRKNRHTDKPERVSEHVDTFLGWRNAVRKGKRLGRCWIDANGKLFPCKEFLANGRPAPRSKLGPAPFAQKSAESARRPGRPPTHDEPMRPVGVHLTDGQIKKARGEGKGDGLAEGVRRLIDKA